MLATNFSEDEKQNIFLLKRLYCLTDLTAGLHIQLTFIVILNIFLSITALLENFLILFALKKEFSLHPPSKFLLRNLGITDLCVGLIVEPLYVTLLVSAVNEHWSTCRSLEVAVLCSVSVDIDCNKRGQTSCSVIGTEIQTSSNTEKSLPDHYYLLHIVHCFCNN